MTPLTISPGLTSEPGIAFLTLATITTPTSTRRWPRFGVSTIGFGVSTIGLRSLGRLLRGGQLSFALNGLEAGDVVLRLLDLAGRFEPLRGRLKTQMEQVLDRVLDGQ